MTPTLTKKPAIAKYPNYSKLQIKHKKIFDTYSNKYGYYCDFDFIDLFAWDLDDNVGVSILNKNLVVRRQDYLNGTEYYSIIGSNKIDDSLSELLRKTSELRLVPKVVVDNIKNPHKFIIENDRDSYDYIYNVKDLVELKGNKYKNIRNRLSNFKREYPDYNKLEVSTTSIVNLDRFKNFQDVFYAWTKDKNLSDRKTRREKIALNRLLSHSDSFDLLIIEIKLGNELVAFSINHIAAPGYAITHFEKAIKIHKYFNSYVIYQVARLQDEFGCKKVNWEDDLGFPGLRQNKSSYHPAEMLNKYQIKSRT